MSGFFVTVIYVADGRGRQLNTICQVERSRDQLIEPTISITHSHKEPEEDAIPFGFFLFEYGVWRMK